MADTPSSILTKAADLIRDTAVKVKHDCQAESCGGWRDDPPCGGCCSCLSYCIQEGPEPAPGTPPRGRLMASKTTCPGCDSHTSGVYSAFREERPCPHCGLSYEAAAEILDIRQKGADEELTARLEQALKELGLAKAEAGRLRWRLNEVEAALRREPPEWD